MSVLLSVHGGGIRSSRWGGGGVRSSQPMGGGSGPASRRGGGSGQSADGGGSGQSASGGGQVQPAGGGQVSQPLAGGVTRRTPASGGKTCQVSQPGKGPQGLGVRSGTRDGGGQHLAPSCGRYASCVHAGGLSCLQKFMTWSHNWTIENLDIHWTIALMRANTWDWGPSQDWGSPKLQDSGYYPRKGSGTI